MTDRQEEFLSQALALEESIDSKVSVSAKLKAAIESAEFYMQALHITQNPEDRKVIDSKCKELIERGTHLKLGQDAAPRRSPTVYPVSMRKLTTRENIIMLEGSKLNGFVFKPWDRPPLQDEFALEHGEEPFIDSKPLPLSQAQLEAFGGWKRPKDALALIEIVKDGHSLPNDPTMAFPAKVDLVQDLTSDCSVVASLCAGTSRVERGHAKISGSIVYPYDHQAQTFLLSPNGKYIFRLYFNGCWRRVEIDDTLPTSANARLLHVIDRSHPGVLWPALTEKAYLKVRGGYDFPGSNSGTDLAVLTGWIPQQVFLHDDEVEAEHLWDELVEAFNSGNVFLTIGTGKLSRREQKQLGLAVEHDYAILDMKESAHVREMLIKNPWADGDVWKGTARRRPNPSAETYPDLPPAHDSEDMLPGTFWMDFNSVFLYYENLYINWNPALFKQRDNRHFSWTLPQRRPASTIIDTHPQFCVQSEVNGQVWLLLNRHFRTGDYTQATNGKNGYISLYLFEQDGYRLLSSESAIERGPFVDSPNTLLRFKATKNKRYTVVVVQQDLPAGKHNFTLSLFSNTNAALTEAPSRYTTNTSLNAAWTRASTGGNSDSVNYLRNPQFQVSLQSDQRVAVVLRVADSDSNATAVETDSAPESLTSPPEIHVKSLLASSTGGRIHRLPLRDIVAHSGDYRRSACVLETTLGRGTYALLCSTFEEKQLAKFTLDFYSSSTNYPGTLSPPIIGQSIKAKAAAITPLPAESSGRLFIGTAPLTFSSRVNRMLAPVAVPKPTQATIVARQPSRNATSSLFRVSLEQGQGPYKRTLADSSFDDEEFHRITTGLRIEDLLLQPEMAAETSGLGGLWLVVERLAQGTGTSADVDADEQEDNAEDDWIEPQSYEVRSPNRKDDIHASETISVELLVEERVEVGAWGIGDG